MERKNHQLRVVKEGFEPIKPKRKIRKKVVALAVASALILPIGYLTLKRRADCMPIPKNPAASSAQYKSDIWCGILNSTPKAILPNGKSTDYTRKP